MSDFRMRKQSLSTGGVIQSIHWQGRWQTVGQWADELGISKTTLYNRIGKGWPPERVMQGRLVAKREGQPRKRSVGYQESGGRFEQRHARWV